MNSFEWNKVAAAVLISVLVFMGVNILTEGVFHVENPEKTAYVVEVAETTSAAAEVVDEGPSLAVLLAAGDVEKGAKSFKKCMACHTTDAGGANKTGPNLAGVMGAAVGHHAGYGYSDALANHGGSWTYEAMDAWLAKPATAIPGNKMSFAGLKKATERANMIAFLRSISPDAPALPVE